MLQKLSHSPPIAVIAFLIIPVLFLGRVGVWAIFGIDFDLPQSRIFRTLLDISIIFGPVIAFGLSALATVQVKFRPEENSLVSITFKKVNLVYYAVIVLSITLLSVFGTYLFFENLPCMLGQQLTC